MDLMGNFDHDGDDKENGDDQDDAEENDERQKRDSGQLTSPKSPPTVRRHPPSTEGLVLPIVIIAFNISISSSNSIISKVLAASYPCFSRGDGYP